MRAAEKIPMLHAYVELATSRVMEGQACVYSQDLLVGGVIFLLSFIAKNSSHCLVRTHSRMTQPNVSTGVLCVMTVSYKSSVA